MDNLSLEHSVSARRASIEWSESGADTGEIYTKPEVVDFMLECSGISEAVFKPDTRILEPACGQGEFVVAIARKLVEAIRLKSFPSNAALTYRNLVTAFDISGKSVQVATERTEELLKSVFTSSEAKKLVEAWFSVDDYLLTETTNRYSHVVGNPPYVRIENIPDDLRRIYRDKFKTMTGRADLYIAFYEKALAELKSGGTLCYICTDRWTKNSYGSALRSIISQNYNLDLYIDLYGYKAFSTDVLTYPAITQISKKNRDKTAVLHNPSIHASFASELFNLSTGKVKSLPGVNVRKDVVSKEKPWLFGSADELALIQRLERKFPLLEDAQCKVLIGVATGNNNVFVVPDNLKVEPDRLLPLVRANDLRKGQLYSEGLALINTYDENGVVSLNDYPLLQQYLLAHEGSLTRRHVAKVNPKHWYKTIDRVYVERANAEKLLIPDIKSQLTVVYHPGGAQPNNSVYYICSESWDLRALQAVLISGLGQLFVETYSTKVSGGNLRFQAQHLRKIRIPLWTDVPERMKSQLREAGQINDIERAKELVAELYGFSQKERQILGC